MADTTWYSHNGREWHVEVGSPAEEHLLEEGAVEIDGPSDGDAPATTEKAVADMTVKELNAFADANELDVDRKLRRDDLVVAIDKALHAKALAATGSGDGDPPATTEGDQG
jgi:hypothetical protein